MALLLLPGPRFLGAKEISVGTKTASPNRNSRTTCPSCLFQPGVNLSLWLYFWSLRGVKPQESMHLFAFPGVTSTWLEMGYFFHRPIICALGEKCTCIYDFYQAKRHSSSRNGTPALDFKSSARGCPQGSFTDEFLGLACAEWEKLGRMCFSVVFLKVPQKQQRPSKGIQPSGLFYGSGPVLYVREFTMILNKAGAQTYSNETISFLAKQLPFYTIFYSQTLILLTSDLL